MTTSARRQPALYPAEDTSPPLDPYDDPDYFDLCQAAGRHVCPPSASCDGA